MLKRVKKIFKPKQLVGIQYLRAAAVLFVVLDHTTGMAMLPKYFGEHFNIFDGWFQSGASGVDLFFVISGFISFMFP
jgi:peptidoglycan/LPS O-acetylase OafA/YrhL